MLSEREVRIETERRNSIVVPEICDILNLVKGYEARCKNPKKGQFIINKDGMNFSISVEPMVYDDELSIDEVMKHYDFLFK